MPCRNRGFNAKAAELDAYITIRRARGEWLGAIEVAEIAEIPWRKIAFALRRLVAKGLVEERIVTYKGDHRSKEETRLYRVREAPVRARTPLQK